MKNAGGALIALGLTLIAGAFFIDVTFSLPPIPGGFGAGTPQEVGNFHAMHIQGLVFQGGFASVIAGSVLLGFGTLAGELRREDATSDQPEPAPYAVAFWAIGIAAGLAVILSIVFMASRGPAPQVLNSSDTAADTQNIIDQANSDIANAQATAENALDAMERSIR